MKLRFKVKLVIAVVVLAFLAIYTVRFVPFGPSTGEPIADYKNPRTALLVMDMQEDFLDPAGRMPVDTGQVSAMLDAANRLLARTAEHGIEPVYVVNAFSKWDVIGNLARNHAAVRDTQGARLDRRLSVVGEALFEKDMPDGFTNSDLDEYLRQRQIGSIVMTGVFADQCVRATAIAARNRGYQVTVLKDAVAAASDEDREQAYKDLEKDGAILLTSSQYIAEL